MYLLQLGHDHTLELIHSEHAHEDVDAVPHLVHAVGLDPHIVGSEVPADFSEVLLVILWRDDRGCRRSCGGVAGCRLGKAEEVTHVVNEGLVLEGLDWEAIHAGNKHLV